MALLVLMGGAGVSLWLVLRAGSHNGSALLVALFVGWVLSPFAALFIASAVSKTWSVLTRVTLYSLMLFIALGSLVGYSGVLSPPGAKPTGMFLLVPLVSWLLMAIVIPTVAILTNKHDI